MSDPTRLLYENAHRLAIKEPETYSFGGRSTAPLSKKILFFAVSVLTHAEAVAKAIVLFFLHIKAIFSRVNEQQMKLLKEESSAAYAVSWRSALACVDTKWLQKLEEAEQPIALPAPVEPAAVVAQPEPIVPVVAALLPEPVILAAPVAQAPLPEEPAVPVQAAAPALQIRENHFVANPEPAAAALLAPAPEVPVDLQAQEPEEWQQVELAAPAAVPEEPAIAPALAAPVEQIPVALPLPVPAGAPLAPFVIGRVQDAFAGFRPIQQPQLLVEIVDEQGQIQERLDDAIGRARQQMMVEDPKEFQYRKAVPDLANWTGWNLTAHGMDDSKVALCSYADPECQIRGNQLATQFNLRIGDTEYPIYAFGVFGAYGGPQAVNFVKENLQHSLAQKLRQHNPFALSDAGISKALSSLFAKLDQQFKEDNQHLGNLRSKEYVIDYGASAVLSLIIDGRLWTASLGKERAVFVHDNQISQLSVLTQNHQGVGFYQLGMEINKSPEITVKPLGGDGYLFLGSETFFNFCSSEQVGAILSAGGEPETIASNLLFSALPPKPRAPVNLSCIVFKIQNGVEIAQSPIQQLFQMQEGADDAASDGSGVHVPALQELQEPVFEDEVITPEELQTLRAAGDAASDGSGEHVAALPEHAELVSEDEVFTTAELPNQGAGDDVASTSSGEKIEASDATGETAMPMPKPQGSSFFNWLAR
jgi:serine/threonine protein phosphatase PrpC